ncbi:MAG TPA: TRAP transporter large permease [Paenalcaligenes hominis]|mgnify:CR=1 FL=1|uniref:TRAP transporter large permease protein n=1 Tax=Paenalcaligenes hominis TaxID=643674 RepID=A0A9D3ABE8_9BURK|nr:TRAP transporter large permease [Paenalcaligenes hominis]NJB65036.1 C4-dicarboxylate transporter DctM subunit [Paenalcaligenes hominis]GGE57148.1 C4-dicarboxylate ABC transporter permease [Paenalcaligenes hominis]HJH24139.1 TRAP transporter large permease [Paenalcaligenes hominis]
MEQYIVALLFGSFIVLLLIGAPITVSLAGAALVAFLTLGKNPISFVQIAFTSVGSFPLMALPAFVLAGALMEAAGISRRLVDIAETLAGPITGGLGVATVLACLFFGAISGSGPATTAAVGMLMIPAMTKRNYSLDYASALTASSGGLGIIIPPSIPMVIFGISALGLQPPPEAVAQYGQFSSVSISKLFIAGVVPGLVMSSSLLILNYIISRKEGYAGTNEGWSVSEVMHALRRGFWSVLAPLIILGGIYAGFFTPTESAVVAVFYTVFVGIFIHRELNFAKAFHALRTTTWITGRVLLILFAATVFGRLLVEQRIPALIAESLLSWTDNMYVIWTLLIAFLLFVGMFMETLAAIMILVPVLLPVTYMFGIDPTHVGIVVICALSVGFVTPPLGENLFVASGIGGATVESIVARALPFVAAYVVAIFIIAFVPSLSLWLPRLMGY